MRASYPLGFEVGFSRVYAVDQADSTVTHSAHILYSAYPDGLFFPAVCLQHLYLLIILYVLENAWKVASAFKK